jgi:hypothetical protein
MLEKNTLIRRLATHKPNNAVDGEFPVQAGSVLAHGFNTDAKLHRQLLGRDPGA